MAGILAFLVFLICMQPCQSEVYSSGAEIEQMIQSSGRITDLVDRYLEAELQRLQRIKEHAQQFATVHSQNSQFFTSEAFANPTSAYLIVKLLASYWSPIEILMRENLAEEFLNIAKTGTDTVPQVTLPSAEDVVGLAKALMIVQTTYELPTTHLADGKLPVHTSPVVMTGRDCFDVGRVAYDIRWYYHTILWMQEALERAVRENPGSTVSEHEILEYLAYPLGEMGEIGLAWQLTKRLHELVPDHPRAVGNLGYYENVLASQDPTGGKRPSVPAETFRKWRTYGAIQEDGTYEHYAALCRGDIKQTDQKLARLHCYYKNDKPFLKLAPFKVELLMLEPMVRLFRGIISDQEIETVTQISFPKLYRSMVVQGLGDGSEISESRVSKNTWLADHAHPNAAILTRRVSDMTNLDMVTAEEYQVANYGIGGHYQPHVDTLLVDQNGELDPEKLMAVHGAEENGDRIATVLFYISQPEAGGATVFPDLNLTLFPSKNDAVFWLNYKKNGRADTKMRHSGCPVLLGTKWILNKWIHERGQEFNRPCSLEENEYE